MSMIRARNLLYYCQERLIHSVPYYTKEDESSKKSTQYWSPKKRLTRHQIDHLRTLRRDFPDEWDIKKLGAQFGISYMAVKRILRSKFEPSEEVKQRQDKKAIENREKRKELSKNKQ